MAGFRGKEQKQIPVTVVLSGDKQAAKGLVPFALKQLRIVNKSLNRVGRKQGTRSDELSNGARVSVTQTFGQAAIELFSPIRALKLVTGFTRKASGLVFSIGNDAYYCISNGKASLFNSLSYGNSHYTYSETVGGGVKQTTVSIDLPRPEMNQILENYPGVATSETVRWLHMGMLVELWVSSSYFQLYQIGDLTADDLGSTYETYYGASAPLTAALLESLGSVTQLSNPRALYINGQEVLGFPKTGDFRMLTGAALTTFPLSELTPDDTQLYVLIVLMDLRILLDGVATEVLYRASFSVDPETGIGTVGELEQIAVLGAQSGSGMTGRMRGLRRCWQFNSDCTKLNNINGPWYRPGYLISLDKTLLTISTAAAGQTLLPESSVPTDYGTRYTVPTILTTRIVTYLGVTYRCPGSYQDSSRDWFGVNTHTGLRDWSLSADASSLTLKATTTLLELASYEDEFIYAVFETTDTVIPFTLADDGPSGKYLVVEDVHAVSGSIKVYNKVGTLLETYISSVPLSYIGCYADSFGSFGDSRYRLPQASGFEITVDGLGNVLAKTASKMYYNWQDVVVAVPGLEGLQVNYKVGKLGLI